MWKFSCIGHRMITTTQMQSPSLITLFAYILCVMCAMDEITEPNQTQPVRNAKIHSTRLDPWVNPNHFHLWGYVGF